MIYLNASHSGETWTKKEYLEEAAKRQGWEIFGDSEDYVLNIEPCQLRIGKKWTGLWHIDVLRRTEYPSYYVSAEVFVSSPINVTHDKTQVLFQALDPVHHKRTDKEQFDFVICGSQFAGLYDKRMAAYDMLKSAFTWQEFPRDRRIDEYIKDYSKARVQFIHTGQDEQGRGAVAQRFFECLGIGPVLTNWTEDLPLTGLVEGEDYLAYRGYQDMVEKMHLLLGDETLRRKIAYNGRRKALLMHTYEHRIASILNTIREHENNRDTSA